MKFERAVSRFFYGSLRRQLITGVMLVHAVMMSLFIWDLTIRQKHMIFQHQIEHTRSLAQSLATSSANWLLADDIAGLQEIVDAQTGYPDLEFVLLTDETGRVLAHSDRSKLGLAVLDMPEKAGLSIITSSRELVDVAVSAEVSGRLVGWSRVGIGQKTTGRRLAKVIRDGMLYTIAAIVAGSFFAWLMGRAFTRRLYIIQKVIDSVKSGDRESRIRLEGTDEAAHLAAEFDVMLDTIASREDALRKSENRLRQANADLENIVAARTRQVKESLALAERSERELKTAQRVARTGSWNINLESNALTWSDQSHEIFGIPPGTPISFQDFTDLIHPEDRESVLSAWQAALTGEPYNIEHRIVVDGRIKWVHEKAAFHFDKNKTAVSGIGTVQDITDRKQMEQRLKESEERYRAIFANSPDAYLMMEITDGKIVDCNVAAEIMLQGDRHTIIGKRPEQISPPYQPDGRLSFEIAKERIAESIENGKNSFEWVHRRLDGTDFWVDVKLSVLNLEGRKVMMVAWRDISENKQTEERLIQLADIVESSDDAIISETLAGIITSWNHGAETLFGYTAEEMIGRSIAPILPRERDGEEAEILRFVSAGNAVSQLESRRIRRDESVIDVSVTASPIKNKQGRITGVSKIIRDITAKKKAEAAQLEAKEAADRANRAKSEFVANMSHEIRTPLNGVIGLSHLMMQTPLTPKQAEYMQRIRSSSKALLGVLNDILDYSKIDAGRLNLEISPLCIDDLLSNIADLFSAGAEEKNLEIFFQVATNVPHCYLGDALRLNQVLNNLVGNAVKFTEKGEIHISIDLLEKSDHDALLSISVSDTGIGIPENLRQNLFKAFSQADSSTTRKYGGTGLGLVISKRIVELMGGTIGVKSRPGGGSTFCFTVRLKTAAGPPLTRDPSKLNSMRVLVADDYETSLLILKQTLESWSFQVATAASGTEALEKIRTFSEKGEPFDLILLDWKMPGLDGLEVVRRIEKISEKELVLRPCVIMMVTASARERLQGAAGPLRLDGLLYKPVIPSTLLELITDIQTEKKGDRVPSSHRQAVIPVEKSGRIRGAHVLLVEDNEINQIVVREFLEAFGLDVTIAGNGRQAVSIHQAARFDAILMDLQMPQMDGLEAVRIIRSTEKERPVPIIAMTAAAMVQDRQACLDVGMNDHIAKPIDPEILLKVLLKWIDPEKGNFSALSETFAEKAGPGSPFTLPGFDLDEAVERVAGNWNTIKRVLRIFAESYRNAAADLKANMEKGNSGDALRLLHNFKGICGNLGARVLYENTLWLEKEIGAGKRPDLKIFDQMLSAALNVIANCPQMKAAPAPLPIFDPLKASELLDRMARIIEENRIVPEDLISTLISRFAGRPEVFLVSKLARQIEKFDYAQSLETIRAIREAMGKSSS